MLKALLVGDLHIKKNSLEETDPLLQKIADLSLQHDAVVIFGDVYNDHGVMTSDVQKQVTDFFKKLSKNVVVFPGNHDLAGDEKTHSLYLHSSQENITVVDKPTTIDINGEKIRIVPYIRSNDQFVDALGGHKGLVFCHADFNGAKYENGFYVKNGIEPASFDDVEFVSGHIHMPARFANVWYIGSPRWISKSDCNQERGIWSVNIQDSKITQKTFLSSSDVSPVYRELEINDDTVLEDLKENTKVYVNFHGIDKNKLKEIQSKYKRVSIKQIVTTQTKTAAVSETKGIRKSVVDYVMGLNVGNKDELLSKIKERLSWA